MTDAILDTLGSDFTVVCPSLPVNGRVVKDGILLAHGVPLAETGMRHHPNDRIQPALPDGNAITGHKGGLVPLATVEEGIKAVEIRLAKLRADGCRYAVLDATTDSHLDTLAAALDDMPLLTGGSGLGAARARRLAAGKHMATETGWQPPKGGTVALSGSCSEMTNR